jgi:hypothetical protein
MQNNLQKKSKNSTNSKLVRATPPKGAVRALSSTKSVNNTPSPSHQEVVTPTKKEKSNKGEHLKYKNTTGRRWWNDTGDLLYDLGSKAFQHGLSMLTGFGDYTLESNSLVAAATHGNNGSEVPIMKNSKVANIVRHREYIGDVIGSTLPFFNSQYPINPGLDGTFPWLAPIANSYTNYRMRGCCFEFVSLATEYSAIPYIGFVAMATQYNSLDPTFTDKKTLENSEYANSCKPSCSMMHPIECSQDMLALHELYIRNVSSLPVNSDKRMYDMGTLNIAVGGQASNTIIGELWVTYEIELYYPKLSSTFNPSFNTYYANMQATQWTNLAPFGPAGLALIGNLGSTMSLDSCTSTAIVLPEEAIGQEFLVVISYFGSHATITAPTVTGNSSTVGNVRFAPQNGVTMCTQATLTFRLLLDQGKKGGFTLGSSGVLPLWNNSSGSSIYITQVPDLIGAVD